MLFFAGDVMMACTLALLTYVNIVALRIYIHFVEFSPCYHGLLGLDISVNVDSMVVT